MDFRPHIEKFRRRFAELEASLSDPKVFDNAQRAQELSKEYARLKELVANGGSYLKTQVQLEDNRALLQSEPAESEMALMAREEIARLEAEEKKLATELELPETYATPGKANQINRELLHVHDRLPQATAEWEDASTELSALDATPA